MSVSDYATLAILEHTYIIFLICFYHAKFLLQKLHSLAPLLYAVSCFKIDHFKVALGFFEIPDVFRELCFIRVFLIPKRFWVVSVCHSEFVGCHSNILLCFCLSVVVTSAWYIMLVAKQFSGIGHSSFLRQLYLFWVGALFGYAFESICGCCVRLWQLSCLAYSCS